MKRRDWYLIAVLLLIAGALALVMQMGGRQDGNTITITVDGEVYGTYSLQKDQEILVRQESGCNQIHIRDGKAWMEEADCPDGYCISQGKISRANETIVCLPHKLVVEVNTGVKTEDSVDVIAK